MGIYHAGCGINKVGSCQQNVDTTAYLVPDRLTALRVALLCTTPQAISNNLKYNNALMRLLQAAKYSQRNMLHVPTLHH